MNYNKQDIIFLKFIALALILFCSNVFAQKFPRVVLSNTELRPLNSEVMDRDYLLYIMYPPSYTSDSAEKYPVLYMTDAYWNFNLASAVGEKLMVDKSVPEYILVGIGYKDDSLNYASERLYELTPSQQRYGWTVNMDARMGGARKFLDSFKTEIIPYVEKNLSVDPNVKALSGSSMGGLFSLFTMYEEPGLFDGIISISPYVNWDHNWMFRREEELYSQAVGNDYTGTYTMATKLYMSVAEFDIPSTIGPIKAMNQIISNRDYKKFAYQFHLVKAEGHSSTNAESFNRGIRFIFGKTNLESE